MNDYAKMCSEMGAAYGRTAEGRLTAFEIDCILAVADGEQMDEIAFRRSVNVEDVSKAVFGARSRLRCLDLQTLIDTARRQCVDSKRVVRKPAKPRMTSAPARPHEKRGVREAAVSAIEAEERFDLGGAYITQTQRDIVQCLADGKTEFEAAVELGISSGVMRMAMSRCRKRLGCSTDIDVLMLCLAHGVVKNRHAANRDWEV